jgi:hypothetical protein
MATIPSQFRAGDSISWTEYDAPSGTSAIRAYLRTNSASGAIVDAVANSGNWIFNISAATTQLLTAGNYLAQFVATITGGSITYREESFTVLQSLVFSGNPTAIETRSATRIRFDKVEAAIDALSSGAQEYRIGIGQGGRMVRRVDLPALIDWRNQLKADLVNEERATTIASGKGDPNMLYLRFPSSSGYPLTRGEY